MSYDFNVGDPDLHNGAINLLQGTNTHETFVQSHTTEM